MRAVARALYAELLSHHQAVCIQHGCPVVIDACLITYDQLVERSCVPISPQSIGAFLWEIGAYCSDRGWPPLNALAVNRQTRMPLEWIGDALGFPRMEWSTEVERCIYFRGYESLTR